VVSNVSSRVNRTNRHRDHANTAVNSFNPVFGPLVTVP